MTASLPSLADSLIQALHQPGQERLLDLVRNPLRLTLLCITWDGTLPETQAQLYENYLKKFYDWNQNLQELRDCAERCQTNITALKKQLNRQLGELAKAALDLPQERFRLSQALVEKYLGEELDDQSLCYLALQLGWLNRVGKDNRGQFIFAFYHATFQEYFAALAVDDWDYFLPRNHVDFPVAGKEYRIFEPQWKQVILLWLGRGDVKDEEKEGFIEKLVNFEDGCGDWNYEVILDRGFYEYGAYFLAAAGIAEFKDCSLADDIVNKIIKLRFEYLTAKATEILMIITREADVALFETSQEIVIDYLIKLLVQGYKQDITTFLAEIAVNNPTAINKLIKLLDTPYEPNIGMSIFNILSKVAVGNERAIDYLVKVIKSNQDEHTRKQAIKILEKIGLKNQTAIDFLSECINLTKDECTLVQVAESLGKISLGNQKAIDIIVTLIKTTTSKSIRENAVISLGEIGLNNQTVINTLIELINTTQNEDPYRENELNFVSNIFFLPPAVTNESTCREVARNLGKIGAGNQAAIDALINLFKTTKDKYIRDQAADSLANIATDNQKAIEALNDYIEHSEDEHTRNQAVNILLEINPKKPYLTKDRSAFEPLQSQLAPLNPVLEELLISPSDRESQIANLLNSIRTTQNRNDINKVTESLQNILLISKHATDVSKILQIDPEYSLYLIPRVVTELKACLSDETLENDFKKFDNCYKVIWQCAQNLPYPDFYRAWHGLNETQTLNLAQLPQLLQTQLTETNLHQTLQLLCIDGSKFDNRDNPATDIYLQLVKKHHCPKSTEGTPRTLTELKIYWQLLDWEKHPILIFYEEAKPQGFSQTFLDFLDRFDATICVITDSPHPTIPTFSPPDPHLIQNIMNWVQRTILEG